MNDSEDHRRVKPSLFSCLVAGLAIAAALVVYWLLLPHGRALAGACSVGVLAAIFWISEVLPLAVTAILIPVGLSAVGVFDSSNAFASFGSPVLFLVLGGYALAAAVRVNHVDSWITSSILACSGNRTWHVLLSLMSVSAFLSMLISNTATTALLLPVAIGILSHQKDDPNLARLLVLSVAYGASIGGAATLVGSPPNAIAAGLLDINFLQWLSYGLPVSAVMLVVALPILLWTYPSQNDHLILTVTQNAAMQPGGKRTLLVLVSVLFLWLAGPQLTTLFNLPAGLLSAASVACLAVAVLMISGCLNWEALQRNVQWGVLLLLGGGLSLGRGLTESGAADWLAQLLVIYIGDLSSLSLLLILVSIAVFATELISNTAVTAKLAPILMGVALQLGLESASLVVPIAIATSMAFMLPVATPPNAMVHASGKISQRDMIRVGFRLNLAAIVVISLVFNAWGV